MRDALRSRRLDRTLSGRLDTEDLCGVMRGHQDAAAGAVRAGLDAVQAVAKLKFGGNVTRPT